MSNTAPVNYDSSATVLPIFLKLLEIHKPSRTDLLAMTELLSLAVDLALLFGTENFEGKHPGEMVGIIKYWQNQKLKSFEKGVP